MIVFQLLKANDASFTGSKFQCGENSNFFAQCETTEIVGCILMWLARGFKACEGQLLDLIRYIIIINKLHDKSLIVVTTAISLQVSSDECSVITLNNIS